MRYIPLAVVATALLAQPVPHPIHPTVRQALSEISEQHVGAIIQKLVSFGSRESNGMVEGADKGVVAARQWIYNELKSYSPRLEVRFDPHPVKKGGRIVRDTEIVNVVAVLPGTTQPDEHLLVGAHYDSLHIVQRQGAPGWDLEATAASEQAPGAADNASGTACVMELARALSKYQFEKTIVFIAFAGEEQGLLGARGYAERAAKEKEKVEAVLNVDTVGTDVTGNGIAAGPRVNVYSGDPTDSPSRSLARLIHEVTGLYMPGFSTDPVFRQDRFGRGGDHTPFYEQGFAAVRFTTPTEQLENQHNERDTFDRVSVPYTTQVVRAVGASLAYLALAPKPPIPGALGRGESHYDAAVQWRQDTPEADLAGYAITMRSTQAPFWEREIFVGNVDRFTLKNILIDEVVLGVRAVDKDGLESLVSAWTLPRRSFTSTTPARSGGN